VCPPPTPLGQGLSDQHVGHCRLSVPDKPAPSWTGFTHYWSTRGVVHRPLRVLLRSGGAHDDKRCPAWNRRKGCWQEPGLSFRPGNPVPECRPCAPIPASSADLPPRRPLRRRCWPTPRLSGAGTWSRSTPKKSNPLSSSTPCLRHLHVSCGGSFYDARPGAASTVPTFNRSVPPSRVVVSFVLQALSSGRWWDWSSRPSLTPNRRRVWRT